MNGELKIERGIPMPMQGRNNKGYTTVLRKMKVGDSVILPHRDRDGAAAVANYALGTGKYSCRKAEGGGYRIWRTK